MNFDPTLPLAFFAGLISFLSPCVLPLVPAYIGYMSGRVTHTVAAQVNLQQKANSEGQKPRPTLRSRFSTLMHAVAFVCGFTFVFVTVGILPALALGTAANLTVSMIEDILARVGGILLIFFGLHFMGILPAFFAWMRRRPALMSSVLTSIALLVLGGLLIYWGFLGSVTVVDASNQLGIVSQPPPLVLAGTQEISGDTLLEWYLPIPMLLLLVGFVALLIMGGAFSNPKRFWTRALNTVEIGLYSDTRRQMTATGKQGFGGSAVMGLVFAAGWTPCIGPIYGAILTMAYQGTEVLRAGMLLLAYSLGLGIPFMLAALFLDSVQGLLRRIRRHMHMVELISGLLLIFIGVLMLTGTLQTWTQDLNRRVIEGNVGDLAVDLEYCLLLGDCPQATQAPYCALSGIDARQPRSILNLVCR